MRECTTAPVSRHGGDESPVLASVNAGLRINDGGSKLWKPHTHHAVSHRITQHGVQALMVQAWGVSLGVSTVARYQKLLLFGGVKIQRLDCNLCSECAHVEAGRKDWYDVLYTAGSTIRLRNPLLQGAPRWSQ